MSKNATYKEIVLKTRIYLLVLVAGLLGVVSVQAEEEKAAAVNAEKKESAEAKKEATKAQKETTEAKEEILKSDIDKFSYAIGLNIGQGMKQQGLEIKSSKIFE